MGFDKGRELKKEVKQMMMGVKENGRFALNHQNFLYYTRPTSALIPYMELLSLPCLPTLSF